MILSIARFSEGDLVNLQEWGGEGSMEISTRGRRKTKDEECNHST